ncbi:MAG: ATP-binding protein, partial [Mariprofundaceae bacterium]|nr:ATP-binding protein [Mariprofundaceae bacterium]
DPDYYKDMWKTIISGRVWHGTLVDRHKDGSFYPAQTTVIPIRSNSGDITHYAGIHRDISEQQKLEEQFRQAQKMEAIGTLVGGIAHDFNNMLSGMLGNLYLAKREIEHVHGAVRKLENVEQLGYLAAEIIAQLLTFARKGEIEMSTFNFAPFIKESIKLARVSIPENIKLTENITSHDMLIHGDVTQLQQVLLNLLNNARDAVLEKAKPTIGVHLSHFTADEEFRSRRSGVEQHEFAHLSVSDNGYGISKKHLEKIFEPFFTTKTVGEGTGLGLAMSYGAIQSHQGILEVESEKGAGSTFHIYLPLQQAEEEPVALLQKELMAGHGETILLVDDDSCVREALSEVLVSLGYTVLTASDGAIALQLFAEH